MVITDAKWILLFYWFLKPKFIMHSNINRKTIFLIDPFKKFWLNFLSYLNIIHTLLSINYCLIRILPLKKIRVKNKTLFPTKTMKKILKHSNNNKMEWLSNQTDVLSEWGCKCIDAIRVLLKASTYVYNTFSGSTVARGTYFSLRQCDTITLGHMILKVNMTQSRLWSLY